MSWRRYDNHFYPRYVSVAERKAKALKAAEKLLKKGQKLNPVKLTGRAIAQSVWGKAWCKSLEFYSDYANRLPRGRSYVRHGMVVDLNITAEQVQAQVCGTHLYQVSIKIDAAAQEKWRDIQKKCSGQIDSIVELLQGKFSKNVMEIITHPTSGLFPSPKEIELSCSCPDYATMCKHVAATLYAVGARLDIEPEALFTLRQVDHMELITAASSTDTLIGGPESTLETTDLSALFGITLEPLKPQSKHPKAALKNKLKNSPKNRKLFRKTITVDDKMQKGYRYQLTQPMGKNFDKGFQPELTPKEMLALGVFGGKYMTDCQKEFPKEWFIKAKLCSEKHDARLNFFKINASQPLSVWQAKGWIHPDDPRGWFQWYCRYYMGRRHEDDARQISRWKKMKRHLAQIKIHCPRGNLDCRRKQRQALLHWAYDTRKI